MLVILYVRAGDAQHKIASEVNGLTFLEPSANIDIGKT